MVETGRVTKAGKPIRKRTVVKLWGGASTRRTAPGHAGQGRGQEHSEVPGDPGAALDEAEPGTTGQGRVTRFVYADSKQSVKPSQAVGAAPAAALTDASGRPLKALEPGRTDAA